jgi:hypothetical protein
VTSDYRRRLMKRFISVKEVGKHVLLGEWAKQTERCCIREIDYALRRRFVDPSTFKMSFLEEPSKEVKAELLDPKNGEDWVEQHSAYKQEGGSETIVYYDCRTILYILLKEYNNKNTAKAAAPLGIFFSVLLFFMPPLTRLYTDLSWTGDNIFEIIIFFLSSAVLSLLFFVSFLSFQTAYRDYDRMNFLLNQLWQIYSPIKLASVKRKIFPTLNLGDPISLQAWLNLRKLVYDYGIFYHRRHKIMAPVTLLLAGVPFSYLISHGTIYPNFSHNHITRIQFFYAFFSIVFGWQFISLVRVCQNVNDHFKNHLTQVRENQQIFQCMHHFRDYYIAGNQDKEIPFDINKIFNNAPRSVLYTELSEWFHIALANKYEDHCDPLVEKLVEMQNEFSKEIERENEFHCKTFLGFEINFAVTGLVTVGYVLGLVYGYLIGFNNRRPLVM